jgi:hypothetical protein
MNLEVLLMRLGDDLRRALDEGRIKGYDQGWALAIEEAAALAEAMGDRAIASAIRALAEKE